MRGLSTRTNWALFGLLTMLLVVLGVAADRVANLLAESEGWVSHTHEVEASLAGLRADLMEAEAARDGYLLTGRDAILDRFQEAASDVSPRIDRLRDLTADNASQQQRIAQVKPMVEQRLAGLQDSVREKQAAEPGVPPAAVSPSVREITSVLDAMQREEAELLAGRQLLSREAYARVRIVLILAFTVVTLLLFAVFYRIMVELRERKRAEMMVRRLSARLLQLQDSERRKIARELHDSIGQYFAGIRMNLETIRLENDPASKEEIVKDCIDLVERGAGEARTLSHLLHPPLLEETGLVAAAQWFVDGFSKRSRIAVNFRAPENLPRLSPEMELVLFRVLQESLTNIHRHSGSQSGDVLLQGDRAKVTLVVRDNGKGIPPEVLGKFKATLTGTGVGLAGMRERIAELGGTFEVESGTSGTTVRVMLPIPTQEVSEVSPPTESSTKPVKLQPDDQARSEGASLMVMVTPA